MSAVDDLRPVLVTGGSGFAGSYIARALADAGTHVVTYDIAEPRTESAHVIGAAEVHLEKGSIDDWPRVFEVVSRSRPRAIVHAGGIMDVAFLDEHPLVALRTNVAGALYLLEAARLLGGVQRFVFLSTIAVIGRVLHEPIDGDHPTITATEGPAGAYSAAKASVESFCFTYVQHHGLDCRIIRPSALYGFGMSWFAPNYMKNIVEPTLEGVPVRLKTGGEVPRDYFNVVDLASLVRTLVEGPSDPVRVFHGGTGEPLRTASDVATIVRKLVPGADVEVGNEWTESDRDEVRIRGRYDVSVARKLGWDPQFTDLEAGIADYIARYRDFRAAEGVPTPPPPDVHDAPGLGS
jgi:nucleoside-diphosphate-sugar epimerase